MSQVSAIAFSLLLFFVLGVFVFLFFTAYYLLKKQTNFSKILILNMTKENITRLERVALMFFVAFILAYLDVVVLLISPGTLGISHEGTRLFFIGINTVLCVMTIGFAMHFLGILIGVYSQTHR